jgi:hypothetical protein
MRCSLFHFVFFPDNLDWALQAELSQQKKALRSKKALPGAKKRSRGQKKGLPGAPERSTFAKHYFLHNNNKVAEANHHTLCLLPLLQHYCLLPTLHCRRLVTDTTANATATATAPPAVLVYT